MNLIKTLLMMIIIASCTTTTDKQKPSTNKPEKSEQDTQSKEQNWKSFKKGWPTEYDVYLKDAIIKYGPNVAKKIKCPVRFFKSLMYAESGGDPFDVYHETTLGGGGKFKHGPFKGKTYMSMGLFQLSPTDAMWYGCPFNQESDVKKEYSDKSMTMYVPKNQFICAIKIMNKQLKSRWSPYFNDGNYWIVLKPDAKYWDKNKKRYVKYIDNFNWYYKVRFKNEC